MISRPVVRRALERILADPGRTVQSLLGAIGYGRAQASARRTALAVPLGDGTVLCRVLGRYRMVASARDEGLALPLMLDGYWELAVTRYISRRLKPGMACADIGANIGYFSVLMGDLVGPAGQITAFEPFAANRALLERNLRLNGVDAWTRVIPAAVGGQAGEVTLVVPENEPKNAIVQPDGLDYSLGRPCEIARAPMVRLDDVAFDRLDFLKIDIEGAEVQAWEGMQATLDRFPTAELVLEVNPGKYADPRAFFERLQARFPLKAIDFTGAAAPISIDRLLASGRDVMLALRRG